MQNDLIDLLDAMISAEGQSPAYRHLADFLSNFGFHNVNVGFAELKDFTPLGLLSNMEADWLEHYVQADYAKHDPLVALMAHLEGGRLFNADLCKALPSSSKALTDTMFDEISDTGFASNRAYVTRSPALNKIVGVNLISDLEIDKLGRLIEQRQFEIDMAISLAQLPMLDDVARGGGGPLWIDLTPSQPQLTPREREVLQWLAAGLQVDRIADRMMLSNPTVSLHIQSAKKRLGASTREQAVAMAMMRGLL
ncbi:MAG: autoinducer binding domain-containing protein [Rhodobacteraceae bacterium]|nr:autoinducer binding domain-containing protein [Paracoccaceae bacterium]